MNNSLNLLKYLKIINSTLNLEILDKFSELVNLEID